MVVEGAAGGSRLSSFLGKFGAGQGAVGDSDVRIRCFARFVVERDESIPIAFLRIYKREPRDVRRDRLLFQDGLTLIERDHPMRTVFSRPRQVSEEEIH